MPKITVFNPRGALEGEGEVPAGTDLLRASLKVGVKHGSACGGVATCSTCHVWVKKGLESLSDMEDRFFVELSIGHTQVSIAFGKRFVHCAKVLCEIQAPFP